eukprot:TRINITY_DN10621_c0_g1_i1.p1 TRINITY_DN10621_c0_g1~~TRINITY_DN10621_c0_g1_i1.p1  ORF type:complete len:473 (-),score=82.54 TRINITY_DN10621_c0_g1_i1:15-1433(-)
MAKFKWVFLCALTCGAHAGGGGTNIFAMGDLVLEYPVETFLMTLFMTVASVVMEKGLHALQHHLKSHHAKQILARVLTELMQLGVISLIFTLCGNILADFPTWVLLFNWAHIVLFMMAVFLIGETAIFLFLTNVYWWGWEKAERAVKLWLQDPRNKNAAFLQSVTDTRQQAFYLLYEPFLRQAAALNPNYKEVSFVRYLRKCQRHLLLELIEMKASSWLCLILLAGLNSARKLVDDKHDLVNTSLCVTVLGLIPVLLFVFVAFGMRDGYITFIRTVVQTRAQSQGQARLIEDDTIDRNAFFMCSSAGITMRMLQSAMLLNVYYMAIVVLLLPEFKRYISGLAVLGVAGIPSFVLLCFSPRLLRRVAVLSSTGSNLRPDVLEAIWQKDHGGGGHGHSRKRQKSGKHGGNAIELAVVSSAGHTAAAEPAQRYVPPVPPPPPDTATLLKEREALQARLAEIETLLATPLSADVVP